MWISGDFLSDTITIVNGLTDLTARRLEGENDKIEHIRRSQQLTNLKPSRTARAKGGF